MKKPLRKRVILVTLILFNLVLCIALWETFVRKWLPYRCSGVVIDPLLRSANINKTYLIRNLVVQEINPYQTVSSEDITVRFEIHPFPIIAGDKARFHWSIWDAKTGEPVALDLNVHPSQNQLSHAYAFHDDLAGEMIHVHPRVKRLTCGQLEETVVFSRGGRWHFLTQISKGTTLYNLKSDIDVVTHTPIQGPHRDMSLVQESGDTRVELILGTPPIKKGVRTDVRFDFKRISDDEESAISQRLKGSNILFALQGKNLIWNEHGDGSVREVSGQSGFGINRYNETKDSVSYSVIFPEAGFWRIRLELAGVYDFFLYVSE